MKTVSNSTPTKVSTWSGIKRKIKKRPKVFPLLEYHFGMSLAIMIMIILALIITKPVVHGIGHLDHHIILSPMAPSISLYLTI